MMRLARPRALGAFFTSQNAAVAAEFAMVIPLLVLLTLGTINLGVMGYAFTSLHYAVQTAARCGAVNATACGTVGDTQTYAASAYVGPTINPSFTASVSATCSSVTGTGTFQFVTGVTSTPVSLSATACYPLQPTS
jgi:Flp pilus assembly protein TadG